MAVTVKGKSNKQLREERAKLVAEQRSYLDANEDAWASDHQAKWDEMQSDVSDYTAAITRRESLDKIGERSESRNLPVEDSLGPPTGMSRQTLNKILVHGYDRDASGKTRYVEMEAGKRGSQEYQAALQVYLRHGANSLTPEQRSALQSDDPTQAGYLTISEQMASELLKDVDDLLFIRQYAKIHVVREAASLGITKRTAKMSSAAWGAELTMPPYDASLAFGKRFLTPHYLSVGVKVSRDLLRRAVMPVDQIVRQEMSIDSAELQEDGFLTGDGAEKPLGVFTASSMGVSTSRDVITGSTTAILADSLLSAKYALKAQYRSGLLGPVRWLFHRDGVKQVAKLKDAENRYMWTPGLREGEPDMLLGFPVDESERAPNTFTDGNYVGLLANWRYYEIADALDMDMLVLTEKYAETNQVGYINRQKTDGMPTVEEAFVRLKCATS